MPDFLIKPVQKIYFGSPGTGKSYEVRRFAEEKLKIQRESGILKNAVEVVFHPEYTYGDFMGKLLPLTQNDSVIYRFYPGHFLQILGMAYRGLIDGKDDHYLLVIDELNRGNAAAIFGTVFQLLDRDSDSDGWSSYGVNISEMELIGLLQAMGYKDVHFASKEFDSLLIENSNFKDFIKKQTPQSEKQNDDHITIWSLLFGDYELLSGNSKLENFKVRSKIKIPPNLSIMATINTSDESIYYLDSAFKRRWDWCYVDSPTKRPDEEDSEPLKKIEGVELVIDEDTRLDWTDCVIGVNKFIRENHQSIRRIEDKQIGWWFIKPNEDNEIQLQDVKDKLMFYLWDNVFSRDKKPLRQLIEEVAKGEELVTYADFIKHSEAIMQCFSELGSPKLHTYKPAEEALEESW